jgi:hypothetical protein
MVVTTSVIVSLPLGRRILQAPVAGLPSLACNRADYQGPKSVGGQDKVIADVRDRPLGGLERPTGRRSA